MSKFGIIGLDHRHIYEMAGELIAAGMECAGYVPHSSDPRVLEGFRKRFAGLPEVADPRRLLEDPGISVIVTAAIPCDRAALAVAAMQHGKDVMSDKPGVTTSPSSRRCATRWPKPAASSRSAFPNGSKFPRSNRRSSSSPLAPSAAWCRPSTSRRTG